MAWSWDSLLAFAVWAGVPAAALAVAALVRRRTLAFASWGLLGLPGLAIGLWLMFNSPSRPSDIGRPRW